jgi:hypothetical protein
VDFKIYIHINYGLDHKKITYDRVLSIYKCLYKQIEGFTLALNFALGGEMLDSSQARQPELQRFLGPQLMDAGLLTQAQVKVIYMDQELSGLPFGEIVVSRGWVKEKTIDYVVRKFVLTNHLMATVKELRSARDILVRELEVYRKKPQAFSQKEPAKRSLNHPNNSSALHPSSDGEGDDGIDWIG